MWNGARYQEASSIRGGRALSIVDRHRQRRKYPFPLTICRKGEKTMYCLKVTKFKGEKGSGEEIRNKFEAGQQLVQEPSKAG